MTVPCPWIPRFFTATRNQGAGVIASRASFVTCSARGLFVDRCRTPWWFGICLAFVCVSPHGVYNGCFNFYFYCSLITPFRSFASRTIFLCCTAWVDDIAELFTSFFCCHSRSPLCVSDILTLLCFSAVSCTSCLPQYFGKVHVCLHIAHFCLAVLGHAWLAFLQASVAVCSSWVFRQRFLTCLVRMFICAFFYCSYLLCSTTLFTLYCNSCCAQFCSQHCFKTLALPQLALLRASGPASALQWSTSRVWLVRICACAWYFLLCSPLSNF